MQKNFWRKSGSIALSIMTCFSVWTTPVAAETGDQYNVSNTVSADPSTAPVTTESPAKDTSSPAPSNSAVQPGSTQTAVAISSLQGVGTYDSNNQTVTWTVSVSTDGNATLSGVKLDQSYDSSVLSLESASLDGNALSLDGMAAGTFSYSFSESTNTQATFTVVLKANTALTDQNQDNILASRVVLSSLDTAKYTVAGSEGVSLDQSLAAVPEQTTSVTGRIVFLDDGSEAAAASRPTPELHLYANGNDTGKTADFTPVDDSGKYLGTFTTETYAFNDLAKNDEKGVAIVYSVADAEDDAEYQENGAYTLYCLDPAAADEDHILLTPDKTNGSVQAGADLVYSVRESIGGAITRDAAETDLSGITLSVAAADDLNSKYLNDHMTASFTVNDGETDGTWKAVNLSKYNPKDGTEIAWKVTADTGESGLQASYDNTSAVNTEDTEKVDAAYNGGSIQIQSLAANALMMSPAMLGAVPAVYTVTNIMVNYPDDKATVTYKTDKDITVTIDGTAKEVKAGATFSMNRKVTSFTVAPATANDTVTLTVTEPGSVISSATQALSVDAKTATFITLKETKTVSLLKDWRDGQADKSGLTVNFSLQYSTDNGLNWVSLDTNEKLAALGYTAMPDFPEKVSNNASEWKYDFTTLHYNVNGTDVLYRLSEEPLSNYYSEYVIDANKKETILQNTLKNPYTATKKWADGSNKYGTRLAETAWVNTLVLKRHTAQDNDFKNDTVIDLTASDKTAEGYYTITESDNSWIINLPNTLGYDSSDFPYSYYLTEPATVAVGSTTYVSSSTVYKPSYLNNGNYSSIANKLFNRALHQHLWVTEMMNEQ